MVVEQKPVSQDEELDLAAPPGEDFPGGWEFASAFGSSNISRSPGAESPRMMFCLCVPCVSCARREHVMPLSGAGLTGGLASCHGGSGEAPGWSALRLLSPVPCELRI